ncbi:MAG TPA: 50S ribosomal protein L21 [Candidatus Dormibacteraeota bacterium]|jgi:large subunit ribosomal protein L21
MEAIVKISGKQYRVAAGQRVTVDRLANPVGEEVRFDQVLLLADGANASIGTPVVDGALVTAKVVAATRGPKIVVFKYKAKKRYRRTRGSRADQSLLEVVSVTGPGKKKAAKAADSKPAAAPDDGEKES